MYTMKEVSDRTGLSYETLKFYCNQALVPNVRRDPRTGGFFPTRTFPGFVPWSA